VQQMRDLRTHLSCKRHRDEGQEAHDARRSRVHGMRRLHGDLPGRGHTHEIEL
jgi:hypothetical protein